ncbi:MAG TPA: oxidoreductase [Methanocorpusculum sp.]|nr:oxidoreductase [Methanocorpusculum sp.]
MSESISEKRIGGCTLGGSLSVTAFISDAVTVVHAPNGCTHQIFSMLHALLLDGGTARLSPIISSNISDKDVVFGGEEALAKALDKAAASHPELIVVATSCVPETIGDDCEGVCRNHPAAESIVYLPTSGFIGGSAEDGENIALTCLAERARKADPVPRTVAIIGEKNLESEVEENYAEVERLLDRLQVRVILRFCRNIEAEDIRKLGQAACFIIRDHRTLRAGTEIAHRFGRPCIPEFPRGFSGSVAFLRDVGSACGIPESEIERAVEDERAYQKKMLEPFADLKGCSINLGIEPFEGTFAVAREIMKMLDMTETADGIPIKLPFYLPVGVSGTVKMLYLWRREKRK